MSSAARVRQLTFVELSRPLIPLSLVGIPSGLVLAWVARTFASFSAIEAAVGAAFVVVTVGLLTILLRILLQWRARGPASHEVSTATIPRLLLVGWGLIATCTAPLFIIWAIDLIPAGSWWEPLPVFTIGLFALGAFALGWGRLEICSEGLWIYHRLLEWNALGSFRWDSDGLLHLTHARRPMFGGATVWVPELKRKVVEDALLARGIPRG